MKTEELELLLMDYMSKKHSVKVKENSNVRIVVLSGDHVLEEPKKYDPSNGRILNFYDGTIKFKATKENIAKYNTMKDTYDYNEIDFQ